MADYREISQQYAQGAIKAAILLNGGAAIALLSQAADLVGAGLTNAIICPMLLWAMGTTAAAVTWLVAFLSTRYVDKYERERIDDHIKISNRYMQVAGLSICAALVFFVAGCIVLAFQFERGAYAH